ncbi:MAG: glutathione S- transferase, nitrogen catabolite repression regulator [Thelocarpon superellum]|nr:MAG: glutathione S- transferase, nitrogen catabolite repression regulator [Thelocarpon superellum]
MEELSIPYEVKMISMAEVKQPAYESINPNGRVPAIQDPNTGITLWESGAIIEYLIETYDTSHKLTYTSAPEKWHLKQWLYFQTSGQGPYFGQAAWFTYYHPEKLESARLRYVGEIKRVVSVLNRALEGKQYLVGDKATYADLAFVPWDAGTTRLLKDDEAIDAAKDYPHYYAWQQRILARPAVKKATAPPATAAQKH